MTNAQRDRRLSKIIRRSRELGLSPWPRDDSAAEIAAELERSAAGVGAMWVARARGQFDRPRRW